jgi:hypothetical protein
MFILEVILGTDAPHIMAFKGKLAFVTVTDNSAKVPSIAARRLVLTQTILV